MSVLKFKQSKIPKAFETRHVIQVGRSIQTTRVTVRWHTVPGLVYSTKELAETGMDRLMRHNPTFKLRVRPWKGELVSIGGQRAA